MQTAQEPQAIVRRKVQWIGALLTPILFLSGCATHTQTGALVGAGTGAAVGTAIGAAAHNPVAGAVIGAAAGTMVGAAAGSAADESERRTAIRQDVAARGGPLSLEQIRDMAHNNVGDQAIINQIRLSRTVYTLTPAQIVWLKNEGISDAVIQAMQMTGYSYVPPRREVVVVEEGPPVVGFGFGYRRRW